MSIQKPFVVKNGIEVNSNLIFGDIVTDRVGIGTTRPTDTLHVNGGIAVTSINVSGIGTIPTINGSTLNYSTGNIVTGVITSISGSTINYSGIVTGGSYRVGGTEVISSARELKNIVSLDAATTATIESAIANAPNTFTDLNVTGISTLNTVGISSNLNVSGISTLGTIRISSGIVTASSGIVTYYGDGRFLSGIATIGGGVSFSSVLSDDLYVTGIGTINNVKIASGIVTAVSGIVTYYGDGSKLTNILSGVGVATAGGVVGTGATILDFRGPGISTVTVSSGIATINITGGGGGGGAVSIGTIAPPTPTNGDLWYSPDYGRTFVWYDEVALGIGSTAVWVDAAPFNINLTQLNDLQVNSLVVVNHTDLNTLDVSGISTLGSVNVANNITSGTLNVTGVSSLSNVVSSGIITASSFVGNLTGTATGLSGTPNVIVGVATASSFVGNLTGTASTASFATTSFGLSGSPAVLVSSAGVNTTSSPTKLYVSGSAASNIVGLGTTDATTTLDFSAANNFSLTLTGNITLANPTGVTTGQSGIIQIQQDSGGSRTIGFGSHWDFPNATAPTLSTGANALDALTYFVRSSTSIITNSLIGIGTL